MHRSEVVHNGALPLAWIPTKGNDIPPCAVPLHSGPSGQLYIARGLLRGEMHIGTASYSSSQGAQLRDRYGQSYTVFEYEVLTCASALRFELESPQSFALAEETVVRTTAWSPVREDNVSATMVPGPTSAPPRQSLGRLVPLLTSRSQSAISPNEPERKSHQSDPPPYTSPVGGWVEVPKEPRPMALNRRESVQFKHLAQSKCFTLIDDTPSMQYSWSQTRAALAGIVEMLSSDDEWGGMNVRFLHHAGAGTCIKTREEFERVFNSVTVWRGEKTMATKLFQMLEESLPSIHETSIPRPVILLIITDGVADDTQELFNIISHFCQKLDMDCIPPHMCRIHILQMGEDRKAVKPLHDFRDRITQRDHDRRILNVVSFHRGRGPLNAQNTLKLLLASTYIPIEEDPDIGERLPPEVIEAQYQEMERIRALGAR